MLEVVRQGETATRESTAPSAGNRWRYPAAVTTAGGCGGLAEAVDWILTTTHRLGGTPLLRVPKVSTVSTCAALREFVDGHRVVVAAIGEPAPSWHHGAVLAVWPDRGVVAELADDPRTAALCVAPQRPDDIEAWAVLARPEPLAHAIVPPAPSAPDPIVAQALVTLSGMIGHPLALSSPSDRRDATAIFDILSRGGRSLDGDAVYAWALTHGWPALGARRLGDLARAFHAGTAPPLPGGNPFQPAVLELWRARASASGTRRIR